MSVYKPFTTSDIVVTPFKVNKTFTFKGESELSSSNITRSQGINKSYNDPYYSSDRDDILLYNSIKQLYYSNFILDKNGSPAYTASFNNDGTITGEGGTTQPIYQNYLSDTLQPNRLFPTASDDKIGVISIPTQIFGEYIKPGTLNINYTIDSTQQSSIITDDGDGNLLENGSKVGDIIYQHGIAILTSYGSSITGSTYGSSIYGFGTYGSSSSITLADILKATNITCSFQSTLTIHESQYKCTLTEKEFNYSQNPSIISGSCNNKEGKLNRFATTSYFEPYITTIGLYNNTNELIAVGKLSQPLQSSNTTDTTVLVNLDL